MERRRSARHRSASSTRTLQARRRVQRPRRRRRAFARLMLMRRSRGVRQHPHVLRAALPFALVALVAGCGGAHHAAQTAPPRTVAASPDPVRRAAPIRRLVPVAAGNLANAVQDAAAAPFAGGAVLIGGLTPADVSSDEIVVANRAGSRRVGRIPGALHDSAAVTIGANAYLFGGGNGVAQIDTIQMIDPRTGAVQAVGHLPAGSSDQAGAAIGHTAYIVGGYTGTRWLA